MKKLLLSSIIMFGICGFATAQNATGSKLAKQTTTTSAATPTPKKSATDAPALTTNADVQPAATDRVNTPAAPVATGKNARVAKTDAATAVAADGTVDAQQKADLQKETVKPTAPAKKN
jgi:hypothetical protein